MILQISKNVPPPQCLSHVALRKTYDHMRMGRYRICIGHWTDLLLRPKQLSLTPNPHTKYLYTIVFQFEFILLQIRYFYGVHLLCLRISIGYTSI